MDKNLEASARKALEAWDSYGGNKSHDTVITEANAVAESLREVLSALTLYSPSAKIEEKKDTKQNLFYDHGWNSRIDNLPFDPSSSTLDWRDGWKDCDEISEEERQEIGYME